MTRRSWSEWFSNRSGDKQDAQRQPMGFDTRRGVEAPEIIRGIKQGSAQ